MAEKDSRTRRFNTYFRQTSKALRALRQTQVFSHINRNIPYNLYKFSKKQFSRQAEKIQTKFVKQPPAYIKGKKRKYGKDK